MATSRIYLIVLITSIVVAILGAGTYFFLRKELPPIPVGVLNSLSGDFAITEKPISQATLMAIEEINAKGGLLGRKIKPIIRDGQSDNAIFKQQATELITQDKVVAIFGTWRSSTRAAVHDIVERYNNILFYPAYDEGIEESKFVVYVGSVANQGILPAVSWSFNQFGKRFFIVKEEDLFPEVASEIVRLHIEALGGEVVGNEYINQNTIQGVVEKIIAAKPSVIINTLDSPLNVPFFKALRAAHVRPESMPTMSLGFDENQLQQLDVPYMVGDYAIRTYFQSIYRPENTKFIANFKQRYGESSVLSSNMEGAYANVYLWSQAVKQACSVEPEVMKNYLPGQVLNAPGGVMYLDEALHAWRTVYIGRIQYTGQFSLIWSSDKQIKPLIYPPYKDKHYWQDLVKRIKARKDQP